MKYMRMIKNPMNFRFCAIPQVMAIATLAEVYNNTNVFKGVVKIRKGLSCKIILETSDFSSVRDGFRYFLNKIKTKIPRDDPSAPKTLELVNKALRLLGPSSSSVSMYTNAALLAGTVVSSYYLYMQF